MRVAGTLLAGVRTATTRLGGVSLREVSVNGQPGAMVLDPSERLIGVVALEIAEGGQIQTVTSVINPDKLRHLGPLADLGRWAATAATAEQSEGQQARQPEHDPGGVGTGSEASSTVAGQPES